MAPSALEPLERDLERPAAAFAELLDDLSHHLRALFTVGRVMDFRAEQLVEDARFGALRRLDAFRIEHGLQSELARPPPR